MLFPQPVPLPCLCHRIGCGRDLAVYAAALGDWWEAIPAGELSQADGAVPLPLPPPSQFVVEPFVTTEFMQVGCLWCPELVLLIYYYFVSVLGRLPAVPLLAVHCRALCHHRVHAGGLSF